MEEEEHEVYGGEIPDVGEMDGDMDMTGADDDAAKELDEMKRRLKEIEDEAAALREMQAKVEKDMGPQDPATIASDQAGKEEVDARSVFVGNVDYACTPEEVQQHFQSCGTVHRVTILTDKFGQPKGFAYVEFVEAEAIQDALQLNESELHGRQLKVLHKMETTNPRILIADKLGIALPQFILDLNGESGGLLLLFTVGLCILLPLVVASIYL
ncbi:BnaC02g43850D [Brassica napus]|uniref:BnaC02g43850D protein n=1 Tax=Brassica napus TaxID=3708 RepID=A0A078H8S1_BRANA|nr:BnaC02g43850D [Brassica napus]